MGRCAEGGGAAAPPASPWPAQCPACPLRRGGRVGSWLEGGSLLLFTPGLPGGPPPTPQHCLGFVTPPPAASEGTRRPPASGTAQASSAQPVQLVVKPKGHREGDGRTVTVTFMQCDDVSQSRRCDAEGLRVIVPFFPLLLNRSDHPRPLSDFVTGIWSLSRDGPAHVTRTAPMALGEVLEDGGGGGDSG